MFTEVFEKIEAEEGIKAGKETIPVFKLKKADNIVFGKDSKKVEEKDKIVEDPQRQKTEDDILKHLKEKRKEIKEKKKSIDIMV